MDWRYFDQISPKCILKHPMTHLDNSCGIKHCHVITKVVNRKLDRKSESQNRYRQRPPTSQPLKPITCTVTYSTAPTADLLDFLCTHTCSIASARLFLGGSPLRCSARQFGFCEGLQIVMQLLLIFLSMLSIHGAQLQHHMVFFPQ